MKQRIFTLALMLTVSFTSVFANDNEEGVNYKATASFKQEFAQAQEVRWEAGKEFVKATFKMNGQVMFAYYGTEGQLLGITRNITVSQLPLNLLSDVKKNYSKSWISDLFEISNNEETAYYITVEDADQKLVLKSSTGSAWTVYKKEKKNA